MPAKPVKDYFSSNLRRGLRCNYCGKMIKPTRRQRNAKTERQTCINCGHSSWSPCKTSALNDELKIMEEAKSVAKTGEDGTKYFS